MNGDKAPTMSRAHCTSRRWSRAGFTLIEILIVVSIIGLMAVIALPNLDYTRYRVDSAVQGLGASLLAAQRAAVTRQHDVIILFDPGDNSVRIHEDLNDNRTVDPGELLRAIPFGEQIVLGRGSAAPFAAVGPGPVTFTKRVNGVPMVSFHRNGAASEYGGVYFTSTRGLQGGHASDARLLVIERATGRVTRYRYTGAAWLEVN
jgi:prepilin-type N-terminal cleavage/methylation domain-containing protein